MSNKETVTVYVSDLKRDVLNWAVAKCEGYYLDGDGIRASNSDVEQLKTPFKMWTTKHVYEKDKLIAIKVFPINVIRYGINHEAGATAPSITFVDHEGRKVLSSVEGYYISEDEAKKAASHEYKGWDIDAFKPSEDWAQGGLIIEREKIAIDYSESNDWCAAIYDSDSRPYSAIHPLRAAMHCYVASKLGNEVEVPVELLKEAI